MRIIVLGGCGRQGSVVVDDLIRKGFDVDVADYVLKNSAANNSVQLDISNGRKLRAVIADYDLVVGAAPASYGADILNAVTWAGVNYVDLSFTDVDPALWHDAAVDRGITILHDCGVAPGLSHLVAGRAIHLGADEIAINVGGVAKDPKENYVITWSPEDLYEEYTRPARIVIDGEIKRVPALSCEAQEMIPALGGLRSFYTDGLRSLLSKKDRVKRMTERTMRWPGHIEQVGELLYSGDFASGINELYHESNSDVLAMKITAGWSSGMRANINLVEWGDEAMSAMARTTALSCSAFVQLVATGTYKVPGVTPPEDIAIDDAAYRFVLDCLSENKVEFDSKYPFSEGLFIC